MAVSSSARVAALVIACALWLAGCSSSADEDIPDASDGSDAGAADSTGLDSFAEDVPPELTEPDAGIHEDLGGDDVELIGECPTEELLLSGVTLDFDVVYDGRWICDLPDPIAVPTIHATADWASFASDANANGCTDGDLPIDFEEGVDFHAVAGAWRDETCRLTTIEFALVGLEERTHFDARFEDESATCPEYCASVGARLVVVSGSAPSSTLSACSRVVNACR